MTVRTPATDSEGVARGGRAASVRLAGLRRPSMPSAYDAGEAVSKPAAATTRFFP